MGSVGIIGTGSYVPEKRLTNTDLERLVETNDEWIFSRTGIKERRIADASEAASDLAKHAAEKAIERAGIDREQLDLIIVATITPDMIFPATSCLLQNALGIRQVATFDLSAACSGFLYALVTAAQFIETGLYKHALVVGVDVMSRIIDWTDRSTCILFGDGAGAAVLGPVSEGAGFLSYDLGGDGSMGSAAQLPAGGSRLPTTKETVDACLHFVKMNGSEVFKFAVRTMCSSLDVAIKRAGISKDQLDFLVPHQANLRIIDAAAKRLDLPLERVVVNIDRYGNMSAASVAVALDEAVRDGRIKEGDTIALSGIGAGMAWGSAILRWGN